MEKKVYEGRVPTEGEIKALLENWPLDKLAVGQVISHGDIETVIREFRSTSRYRSVTERWRQIVSRETSNIIGVVRNVGFKVLTDSEKVGLSSQKLFTAGNYVRKAVFIGARVDMKRITADEKARLMGYQIRAGKINTIMQIKPVAELPMMENDNNKVKRGSK